MASQAIADLARLRAGARAADQPLPTRTLEVDVRFADAAARSAFAAELGRAVAELAAKDHDEKAPGDGAPASPGRRAADPAELAERFRRCTRAGALDEAVDAIRAGADRETFLTAVFLAGIQLFLEQG